MFTVEYMPSYDLYIVRNAKNGEQVFSTPYRSEAMLFAGMQTTN